MQDNNQDLSGVLKGIRYKLLIVLLREHQQNIFEILQEVQESLSQGSLTSLACHLVLIPASAASTLGRSISPTIMNLATEGEKFLL